MKNANKVKNQIFIKLLAAFLVIIMIPIAELIYFNKLRLMQTLEATQNDLSQRARKTALRIDDWSKINLTSAQIIARQPDIISLDSKRIKPILEDLKIHGTGLDIIRVDNSQGQAIARSDNKPLKNYSHREYFKEAIQGDVGQELVIGITHPQPIFCFGVPIRENEQTGRIIGALHMCSTVSTISSAVTDLKVGETGYAMLADDRNMLMATGDSEVDTLQTLQDMSRHPVFSQDKNGFFDYFDSDNVKHLAYKIEVGMGWHLVIQQRSEEVLADVRKQQNMIIIVIIFTVILSIILGIFLSHIISKPVKRAYEELQRRSLYDSLTGLPNRYLLKDRMEFTLSRAKRLKDDFAYIIVDFTDFKFINDTYGHQAGDKALKTISERIKKILRDEDTFARVGGDEFIILLFSANEKNIELLLKRIIGVSDEAVIFEQQSMDVKFNMGISLYPQHGKTEKVLDKYADDAMYLAKKKNRDYCIYDKDA